ncbi:MAG: tyrosine--tRNA ligase [Candidatus Gracilibacteria bacterium]|nr:tyrosine--tRNA ligase [Candidatus Gracilibacteria bacterium]MDQ7022054.1 tyrosine--tRNA ligase [Candidatus Gracilibacteria bacterium]
MKNLKQELEERALLFQNSSEDLFELYNNGGESFYVGYDPTADSLHLGNFIGFMAGVHFMRRQNKYFALIGGATGMIGDPGGKDAERSFLSKEDLQHNEDSLKIQIGGIFENLSEITGENFDYEVVNNKDFFEGISYLDFLREVGKYVTINKMMSKDTVKKRIEDPKQSISYTEFSYMLLQGYDFYRLFSDRNVKLQMGGQDQWGNLVTGSELIRKKVDGQSYVATWPLITDSSGKKFGKSEGNAIWLDKNKTSPYEIYQYFMNCEDVDVDKYLKILTLIETEEINEIVKNHLENPGNREGQKKLAYSVVEIIHGKIEADLAIKISEFMFGKGNKLETLKTLSLEELKTFQNAMGGFDYISENLFETIVKADLAKSNGDARNSVKAGAIYINEEKISAFDFEVKNSFIDNKFIFIRKGKKNLKLILK